MNKKVVIFGYGARGHIYADYISSHSEQYTLVSVIENLQTRYIEAKQNFNNIPIYNDYHDFLKAKIKADIVIISTQDAQHAEHAIAMMENGYDLLLEKPIANNYKDCIDIYNASIKYNRKVVVCHVLRYAPYYVTIKKMLDEGVIGNIQTINCSENIGYWHFAHSYVRGPWRNSKESSCVILAKCCHDLDIICYLMGKKCLSLSSVGSNTYFTSSNAPKENAKYCSECKNKDCIFNAQKIYTTPRMHWTTCYFSRATDDAGVLKDLKKSQYDRCVFHCDNDVADRQMTIMRFEEGKTAVLSMDAFSKNIYRDIKIHGDKGEILGDVETNIITLRLFNGEDQQIDISKNFTAQGQQGHGGGDYMLMDSLYKYLNGEKVEGITSLQVSLQSHKMAFAAEHSRVNKGAPEFFD